MDDAVQAMIIAFSVIIFVIALSLALYVISQANKTSEYLSYYADSTKFYDNIDLQKDPGESDSEFNERKRKVFSRSARYVSAETIVPTLYRYNKENFCVKIYDNFRKFSSNF